jgi:uncharacterized membrane protein
MSDKEIKTAAKIRNVFEAIYAMTWGALIVFGVTMIWVDDLMFWWKCAMTDLALIFVFYVLSEAAKRYHKQLKRNAQSDGKQD